MFQKRRRKTEVKKKRGIDHASEGGIDLETETMKRQRKSGVKTGGISESFEMCAFERFCHSILLESGSGL